MAVMIKKTTHLILNREWLTKKEDKGRILVYCTKYAKDLLIMSPIWSGVGTFKCCLWPFLKCMSSTVRWIVS